MFKNFEKKKKLTWDIGIEVSVSYFTRMKANIDLKVLSRADWSNFITSLIYYLFN